MDSSLLPTGLLTAVIIVLFLHGWVRTDRALPLSSLLVSIGIFGTFLGIAYALFGFDATAIDDSVPSLLVGMRVAFVTSVAGVFFAVLLRARHILNEEPGEAVAAEATGQEAIDSEALDELRRRLEEVVNQLNGVRRAVAGTGEGSLVTQLKHAREQMADHVLQIERHLGDRAKQAGNGAPPEWSTLFERLDRIQTALDALSKDVDAAGSAGGDG